MLEDTSNDNKTEQVPATGQKTDQVQQNPTAIAKQTAKKAVTKGMNKTIVVAVVAVLVVGGLYLKNQNDKSRKEKTAENLIESITGNKVDLNSDDNSISIKDDKNGESTTIESGQKLPSDFPKDKVPYIDEKKVTLVISNSSDGKKHWSVTTTVDKTPAEANAFFEKEIVEPKYTDVGNYSYNDTTTFSAKTTEYSIFVTVTKSSTDADTVVSYVIEQE